MPGFFDDFSRYYDEQGIHSTPNRLNRRYHAIIENNKEVAVSFADTGPGISEDQLKFVFDPFFTSKETGMGLGLSICYDITQNHNGRIVVDSTGEEGATFTVYFPLVSTQSREKVAGD